MAYVYIYRHMFIRLLIINIVSIVIIIIMFVGGGWCVVLGS